MDELVGSSVITSLAVWTLPAFGALLPLITKLRFEGKDGTSNLLSPPITQRLFGALRLYQEQIILLLSLSDLHSTQSFQTKTPDSLAMTIKGLNFEDILGKNNYPEFKKQVLKLRATLAHLAGAVQISDTPAAYESKTHEAFLEAFGNLKKFAVQPASKVSLSVSFSASSKARLTLAPRKNTRMMKAKWSKPFTTL